MQNVDIWEVEEKVCAITKELSGFRYAQLPERRPHNYNSLGTLVVNLHVLRSEINKLIDDIKIDV